MFTNDRDVAVRAGEASSLMEVETNRAVQEVQAASVLAKKFPRDEQAALEKMLKACKRRALAEIALYEFPRGGQKVTGPSIRMAEMMAQNWGNLDFGIRELEQGDGQSTMMAYCWDLETNVRQTRIFQVTHTRDTKQGPKALTDQRDIYENNANLGARRLRACILGVIPGDIIDSVVDACERTLSSASEPLAKRIEQMADAFARLQVTPEEIEAFLGHKLSATSEGEMVRMQKIYRSISDGMADPADFFGGDDRERAAPKRAKVTVPQTRAARSQHQAEQPAAPEPATGGDFAAFTEGPPSQSTPVARTRKEVQSLIYQAMQKLKLSPEQLETRVRSTFKKAPIDLLLPEMERLLSELEAEIARVA